MIGPWIGIALLGISWLLGLDYYETASPWAQAVVLILGAWMLIAGERAASFRVTREAYPELTVAILLLLLPVAWWTPWPYRLSPLAIIAGLMLERVPFARRVLRPVAAAWVAGGVILLAQSVVLTLYAAVTARSHDLPGVFVKLFAGLSWLTGIDAAADGPLLVVQSMRLPHRLAITWDMVVDPATLMFLAGGLAWIAIAGLCGEILALLSSLWRLSARDSISPTDCVAPLGIAMLGAAISAFAARQLGGGLATSAVSCAASAAFVIVCMYLALESFRAQVSSVFFRKQTYAALQT